MKNSYYRLGVDIGGTFTDVVLEKLGETFSSKVLTTYAAPETAIIDGLHQVCQKAGIKPEEIGQIIHGTTLATNALIERRGAKTALITTNGFRDVIEMRTESRFEQYDLNLNLPDPLLPRQMRFTVDERVDANGDVLIPLQRADVEAVVEQIAVAGFDSVAVGLIHSYLNPAHEQMVRDVLREKLPDVAISISSEVSPQMREYERFNTVVANAYIKPLMASYLGRLEARLASEGVNCRIFLMHSGGGIISIKNGGAVFAANIAARYDLDKVLSFDMGGTTAKICLIKNQTPKTSRVFEVARTYRFKKGSGMPISIPVIDMVEIGAGGGSLAHVDSMRQIRVGPESAGSEPGPSCYGRGGEHPAVTDADLVLGKLDAGNFAGGSITLYPDKSRTALQTSIGDIGGAAPLHAGRLCEKLGVDRLIVPPGAGVGSAIGFLRAPFSFEANRSVYMKLSDFDGNRIKKLLGELKQEATGFVRSCDEESDIFAEFKVYMRYSGQGWEIPIELTEKQAMNPSADTFLARFEEDYTKLFGRVVAGMDVEITVWSVNATTPPETVDRVDLISDKSPASSIGARQVFDPVSARYLDAHIVDRDAMQSGQSVSGPAAIVEAETTIIVPASRNALRQTDGCIDVLAKG